jgi:hypothetical protein
MYKRGELKIYLDKEQTKESVINHYSNCRDGVIERVEYRDCSGYGTSTELYLCSNTKHEVISIVRHIKTDDEIYEDEMTFDSDSFKYLEKLLSGKGETLRDYSK